MMEIEKPPTPKRMKIFQEKKPWKIVNNIKN